jgi:RNA polymerase sigma factor (sigma-70 family)
VIATQQPNPRALTPEQQQLAADHAHLPELIVGRLVRRHPWLGRPCFDPVSEANLALVEAARQHQPPPERFRSRAVVCISRRVMQAATHPKAHSALSTMLLGTAEELPQPGKLGSLLEVARLHRSIARLPRRLRGIVRWHYGICGRPKTLKELAQTYEITPEEVAGRLKEARSWLREKLS